MNYNIPKERMIVGFLLILFLIINGCMQDDKGYSNLNLVQFDSLRIITSADKYLKLEPIPLTNFNCDRSLGTVNDFYSEGDYWWPDSTNIDAPYVRRDGMTNPENFKAHRKAMRDMSVQVAALTAAFKITNDKKYANHAVKHLQTWFINRETRMNPNMNYAQAIKGICAGRGVGLIDGIHLVEPARAVTVIENNNGISKADSEEIKKWYSQFLVWVTTHEYGIDERERENNHGTCWVMQVAEYARLTNNNDLTNYCIERYKTVLLPNQLGEDGSFPMELKRTKPYGYSLFHIDIYSIVCQILSTPDNNLWAFELADGRGIKKGIEFIYPFIKDKSTWPYAHDVMYWDQWPVRHPSLIFAGEAFHNAEYITLWKSLEAEPSADEGMRNFPIRQPILWMN